MNFNAFCAVAYKQIKDLLKNKTVLIQFILFPIMDVLMLLIVPDDLLKKYTPVILGSMFVGMTPMTSMASILAEEKEKGTLKALRFAFVGPFDYLLGIGSVIMCSCTLVALVFVFSVDGDAAARLKIFAVFVLGIIASLILGALLGLASKNQMSAASLTSPVALITSMLPLFSSYNENIRNVSHFLYTQQINDILNNISVDISVNKILVIAANILLFVLLFIVIYKRKKSETF